MHGAAEERVVPEDEEMDAAIVAGRPPETLAESKRRAAVSMPVCRPEVVSGSAAETVGQGAPMR